MMISVGVVMTVNLSAVSLLPLQSNCIVSIQFDYVWMPQQLKVLYFSFHSSSHVLRYKLLPRYDLESDLLSADAMRSKLDFAK